MPTVRVSCLLCEHPVDVPVGHVVLYLEHGGRGTTNRYGFTCPSCSVFVVRQANRAVVDALLATDVKVATGALPPWESGDRPDIVLTDARSHVEQLACSEAPPITEADVLLFRKALEDDSILAAWASS